MAADFGYLNARVRGLRAKLLPEGFASEQLEAAGFASLTQSLAQSAYARDLEDANAGLAPLSAVDAALAAQFVRVTRTLLDAAKGDARALIALLLRRYDLANLKAVVRGLHAGRNSDDIMGAVLAAGELSDSTLRAMAGSPDLAAAGQPLAAARHPLADAFRRAAAQYRADQDLLRFEVALDRAFYQRWAHDAQKLPAPVGFRALAAAEVDATNLRTAMKLRGRQGSAEELYVKGGVSLPLSAFNAIAAQAKLEPLPTLTGALAAASGLAAFGDVDAKLELMLDKMAGRLSLRPLDVGLVTDYLRRKAREIARLRLLARGKYYGVPRAMLERELSDA